MGTSSLGAGFGSFLYIITKTGQKYKMYIVKIVVLCYNQKKHRYFL